MKLVVKPISRRQCVDSEIIQSVVGKCNKLRSNVVLLANLAISEATPALTWSSVSLLELA
jgi:hypothetical protein